MSSSYLHSSFSYILGIIGFLCTIYCLKMVTPTAAATLRTTQIIVAVVVQGIFKPDILETIQTLGGILILMATLAVIFDYEIEKIMSKLCACSSCRNDDNRFTQVGIANGSSWEDTPYMRTNGSNAVPTTNVPVRSHAVRRLRVVSISIS